MTDLRAHYALDAPAVVIGRTPALPFDTPFHIYESPDPEAYLRDLLRARPEILMAIAVASPSLAEAARGWIDGAEGRSKARVPLRTLAYVARMACRPTPFGLFASVAPVSTGETTTLALGAADRTRFVARPDMGWLFSYVARVESDPEQRGRLRVFSNDAVLERDGRLYVSNPAKYRRKQHDDEYLREDVPVSLKHTDAVRFVRERARNGIVHSHLAGEVAARFEAPVDAATHLLGQLWEAGVILSELRPSPCIDPARYVVERAHEAGLPLAVELSEALAGLQAIGSPDARPLSEETFVRARDRFTAIVPAANVFQVDALHAFDGELGREVLREAATFAILQLRAGARWEMRDYSNRFVERYEGTTRLVPLLELVSSDFGLGSPGLSVQVTDDSKRNEALLEIAARALARGSGEIALTAEDLRRICPDQEDAERDLPDAFEVGFQVAASSLAALRAGDFTIAPSALSGSIGAGKIAGRFAHLFGDETMRRIRSAVPPAGDAVDAELVYAPAMARNYNVTTRPSLYAYEIAFGVAPSDARRIPLDDLWVGLENDRFFLWSASMQRVVRVRESHVFNTPGSMPNLCRFLSLLAVEGLRGFRGFPWGEAAHLPALPRLRIGRIVLALQSWNASPETFADAGAIAAWRREWKVPARLFWCEGDNRLPVDLDCEFSLAMLRDQIKPSHNRLEFCEIYPSERDLWIERRAERFATEFVAGYARSEAATTAAVAEPRRKPAAVSSRASYGPGSEWMYAKLYIGANRVETLLAQYVSPLLVSLHAEGALSEWFFVRYADPLNHIRLRWRWNDGGPSLRSKVLERFEDWMSRQAMHRVVMDTYDPEYERYGPDRIRLVERFFTLNSARCLDIVTRNPDESPGDRIAVAAEELDAALAAFYESAKAIATWRRQCGPPAKLSAGDWATVKQLKARGSLAAGAESYAAVVTPILPTFSDTAEQFEFVRAAAHMHCNRLGLGGRDERRVVDIVWQTTAGRAAIARETSAQRIRL